MAEHEFQDGKVSASVQARIDPSIRAGVSPPALPARGVDRIAHAAALKRKAITSQASMERSLLALQRQYGNQYVGQVLSRAAEGEGRADTDLNAIGREIETARGGGNRLDGTVRDQMQSSFGADFSGVRVHTDTRADGLSRALEARAFTTGRDIFFRHGEYSPGSSDGRALLAHELTHVVQQNGAAISRQMTVSQPQDPEEVEAEQMSRAVMQQEQAGPRLQRQPEAVPDNEELEKRKRLSGQA